MTIKIFSIPTLPTIKIPVRVLLEQAGLDVSDWAFTKDGEEIENPNDNIGRNTNWSFIGKEREPIVLCIWHRSVDWSVSPAVYRGNEYIYQNKLIALAGTKKGKDGLGRLSAKIKQSRQLHNTVYQAKDAERTIKLILVEGDQVPIEESAEKSSKVKARGLDPVEWFVHEFDGLTGDFLLVRGVRPTSDAIDLWEGVVDPGDDPALHALISSLSETERDAVIKARVGQGPFRDALIERWASCSVTGFGLQEILIASHIKPWSKCETAEERLGAANGVLLTPNLDKLFDKGLISFDGDFRIIFSSHLKDGFARMLYVDKQMRLRKNHADMLPFLEWHRRHILRQ